MQPAAPSPSNNVIDFAQRRAAKAAAAASAHPNPPASSLPGGHAAGPSHPPCPPGVHDPARAQVLLVGRADLGLCLDQLVNLAAHASIGLTFAHRLACVSMLDHEHVVARAESSVAFEGAAEHLYQWLYRRGQTRLRLLHGQPAFAEIQYLARAAGQAFGLLRTDLNPAAPHALMAIGPIIDPAIAGALWARIEQLALPLSPIWSFQHPVRCSTEGQDQGQQR